VGRVSAGSAPDRFLVALAVLSLLSQVAGQRPLVCVVDDEQWLDQASAPALGFVARRLGAEPVGLVFAARAPGEELAGLPELAVAGLPVLVARLTGVQHSFWVVLGALSVLRSNALNTGQDAVRAILGTVAGFIVGAALLVGIGTNTTVLWFLLPLAVFLAGVALVPQPLAHDTAADGRLVWAVRRYLLDNDGSASATAIRTIWTSDHLDVARRLQAAITSPARATAGQPRAAGPGSTLSPSASSTPPCRHRCPETSSRSAAVSYELFTTKIRAAFTPLG
jgi:hypothetical protein